MGKEKKSLYFYSVLNFNYLVLDKQLIIYFYN